MRIVGSPVCPGGRAAGDPTDALLADQSHSIPDNLVALFDALRAWNCSADKRLLEAAARRKGSDGPGHYPSLCRRRELQASLCYCTADLAVIPPQSIDQSRSTIALTEH